MIKFMLSTYLYITKDYRNSLIIHLGLSDKNLIQNINKCPKLWLFLAKIPPYGKELAKKGFEYIDTFFV